MALAGRASDQFSLRFPDGLRERIKAQTKKTGRSMNSEIVFHLERVFAPLAATGEEIGVNTPAAASSNNAALAGGASINRY